MAGKRPHPSSAALKQIPTNEADLLNASENTVGVSDWSKNAIGVSANGVGVTDWSTNAVCAPTNANDTSDWSTCGVGEINSEALRRRAVMEGEAEEDVKPDLQTLELISESID